MDTELYDEFGNYIGPDMDSEESEESEEEEIEDQGDDGSDDDERRMQEAGPAGPGGALAIMDMDSTDPSEGQIVLHEDKNYYPGADEVYPGVNTVLLDEDAQDLSEPILKRCLGKC